MRRFIIGRKGQGSEGSASVLGTHIISYVAIFLFIVFPVAIVLAAAAYTYQGAYKHIDPASEKEIIVERAMTCFAQYDEELNRHYPIIELDMATRNRLQACFSNHPGIKVTIEDAETKQPVFEEQTWTKNIPSQRSTYNIVYEKGDVRKQGIMHIDT